MSARLFVLKNSFVRTVRIAFFLLILFVLFSIYSSVSFAGNDKPALWRVQDSDTTIYLFGTLHILEKNGTWTGADLYPYLKQSKALYLEITPEDKDPAVMMPYIVKYALLPTGDKMSNHLPPDLYKKLIGKMVKAGVPKVMADHYRPWFGTVTYQAIAYAQAGFDLGKGVESVLSKEAAVNNIPVFGLETAEMQLSMLSGMSKDQEVRFVESALKHSDSVGQMLKQLTLYWQGGKVEKLDALVKQEMTGGNEDIAEIMLYKRNRNWVAQIKELMNKSGQYFLAVGGAHLVGKKSVNDLLEQDGFKVERIH